MSPGAIPPLAAEWFSNGSTETAGACIPCLAALDREVEVSPSGLVFSAAPRQLSWPSRAYEQL